MQKWALITGAIGTHAQLLDIARPSFTAYAKTWKMDYDEVDLGGELPPSWYKIPAIRQKFEECYDGVMWVDADAVIVNPRHDIREEAHQAWNWVVHDLDGDEQPNCGVLVLRNHAAANKMLESIWAMRETYAHHPWWEQAPAMLLSGWDGKWPAPRWVGATPYTVSQNRLSLRWNVLAERTPCADPYIIHAAALPLPQRAEVMRAA